MQERKRVAKLYGEYLQAMAAEARAFECGTEAEVDAAIERTIEAERGFSDALVSFSRGELDARDVMRMLAFRRDELDALMARMAA